MAFLEAFCPQSRAKALILSISGSILGSILEVQIGEKSIKNDIKFEIKIWKAFVIDFEWISNLCLKLFLIKMPIKVEKSDFSKIIKNL